MANYFQEDKKKRLDSIVMLLEESKSNFSFISYDKLIIDIQYKWGLAEKRAKEYVEIAMQVCNAKNVDGEIVFTKEEKHE